MEIPSPTSFHLKKNAATTLERSAVAPIATQRIFVAAYTMDSQMRAIGGCGLVFTPNLDFQKMVSWLNLVELVN